MIQCLDINYFSHEAVSKIYFYSGGILVDCFCFTLPDNFDLPIP